MTKQQRNAKLLSHAVSRAAADAAPEDRAAAEALCRLMNSLLGADAATLRQELGGVSMPSGFKYARYSDSARRSVGTSFTFTDEPIRPWTLAAAIGVDVSGRRRGSVELRLLPTVDAGVMELQITRRADAA